VENNRLSIRKNKKNKKEIGNDIDRIVSHNSSENSAFLWIYKHPEKFFHLTGFLRLDFWLKKKVKSKTQKYKCTKRRKDD